MVDHAKAPASQPFAIVIDTREQTPFVFGEWPTVPGKLDSGDYSILGLTDLVAIERKSLDDLVACCGTQRERFERELRRLRGYKLKAVVIEASRKRVARGGWRSKILPQSVLGSIASWRVRYGIEFIYADDAEHGADETLYLLRKFHDYLNQTMKRVTAHEVL
jgi:ERCC4-type nuclease